MQFFLGIALGLIGVLAVVVVAGPPAPRGVFGEVILDDLAPDMERRRFPRLAISIDTPKGWHDIDEYELRKNRNIALIAGPGSADRVILATANAPKFEDADAMAIFIDAGPSRGNALGFMEQIETALQAGMPGATVTESAKTFRVNGFDGASVGLRMPMRGIVGVQPMNVRFYLLEIGDRSMIVSAGAVTGIETGDMVNRVVRTIRVLQETE